MTLDVSNRYTGGTAHPGPTAAPLGSYLNDHLLAATTDCELARRVATQHARSPAGQPLIRVADELAEDRATLQRIMGELGIRVRRGRVCAGWLLEKAQRAKSNGLLAPRAPVSSLLELETLRRGVEGRHMMWHALRMLSGPHTERLDDAELAELTARARKQSDTLEALRLRATPAVLNLP